jgi:hypothetical protein
MDKKEDFELFKKEFSRYQKEFGLEGYKVLFLHKPLKDENAHIYIDPQNMTSKVCFTTLKSKDPQDWNIKRLAKHEAIHLLLGRLSDYGLRRFVPQELLLEAEEEVVRKLLNLIKEKR